MPILYDILTISAAQNQTAGKSSERNFGTADVDESMTISEKQSETRRRGFKPEALCKPNR